MSTMQVCNFAIVKLWFNGLLNTQIVTKIAENGVITLWYRIQLVSIALAKVNVIDF